MPCSGLADDDTQDLVPPPPEQHRGRHTVKYPVSSGHSKRRSASPGLVFPSSEEEDRSAVLQTARGYGNVVDESGSESDADEENIRNDRNTGTGTAKVHTFVVQLCSPTNDVPTADNQGILPR